MRLPRGFIPCALIGVPQNSAWLASGRQIYSWTFVWRSYGTALMLQTLLSIPPLPRSSGFIINKPRIHCCVGLFPTRNIGRRRTNYFPVNAFLNSKWCDWPAMLAAYWCGAVDVSEAKWLYDWLGCCGKTIDSLCNGFTRLHTYIHITEHGDTWLSKAVCRLRLRHHSWMSCSLTIFVVD